MSQQDSGIINSSDEAIAIIETQKEGIPFAAIKYLRNQRASNGLKEKIIFALEHAYDDTYYDEEEEFYYTTPLWYAIIAEEYIDEELIDPVISLFTATCEDWDFLCEQGEYLIEKLAAKYPDLMMEKVMDVINRLVKNNSELPYLYLFNAFNYIDAQKYKDWFLTTLKDKGLYWRDAFANHLVDLRLTEAIPIIKDMLKEETHPFVRTELHGVLKLLETGVDRYQDTAYSERRGDWEAHYLKWDDSFYPNRQKEKELSSKTRPAPVKAKKIGRNEPCSCGSGKKYKKCCLSKD